MCPRAGTWALRCANDPQLHMLVSCGLQVFDVDLTMILL
jgi:hypothetical protein